MRVRLESSLVQALLTGGAFLLLSVSYADFIVPLFSYENYSYHPNVTATISATLAAILISVSLPRNKLRISSFYLRLTVLISMLPMLVLYSQAGKSAVYIVEVLASYGVLVFCLRIGATGVRLRFAHAAKRQTVLYGALLIVVLYLVSIVAFGGLRYLNFDVSKVYDLRTQAAALLPGVYGYLSPTMREVLLPAAVVLAVHEKRWGLLIGAFGMSVLIFGLTQDRGPLAYPLFALGAYTVARARREGALMILTFCILIGVSIIALNAFGVGKGFSAGWVAALIFERGLFAPSNLNYMYYDYFSRHSLFYWSNSSLTAGLLGKPDSLTPANVIGVNYFNSYTTFANTGWLGSGYMQCGLLGMVVYAVIISRILRFLDSHARGGNHADRALMIGITAIPILSMLMSSDLPSTFLTGGLLWALLGAEAVANRERPHTPKGSGAPPAAVAGNCYG